LISKWESLENNPDFTNSLFYNVKIGMRAGSGLIAFAFTSFSLVDPVFKGVDLEATYRTRTVIVSLSLLLFGISFLQSMQTYQRMKILNYLALFVSGFGVSILTMMVGGPSSNYWSMLILTFFGGTLLFNFTILQCILIDLVILAVYIALLLYYDFSLWDPSAFVSVSGLIISMLVSAVASGYLRHLKVVEYKTLKELNASNQNLEKALKELAHEKEKSERLLLNILPETIAHRLKYENQLIADRYEDVSVLFADLVNFTNYAETRSPEEIVNLLNRLFSIFDRLTDSYELEKIKTIGDAYLVVGGLPNPIPDHLERILNMALDMQKSMEEFNQEFGENFQLRIGIHSGPAVAGVIGQKKFIYDLWGDSVNTASRMESTGVPGKIQISEYLKERVQNLFAISERGYIEIKGKGKMKTFFLDGKIAS